MEKIKKRPWNEDYPLLQETVSLNGESGQVELVAAVSGKQIQVEGIMAGANSATVYTLQSANTTVFPLLMSAGGGLVKYSRGGDACLFATDAGEALNVSLGGNPGASSYIYIQYRLV